MVLWNSECDRERPMSKLEMGMRVAREEEAERRERRARNALLDYDRYFDREGFFIFFFMGNSMRWNFAERLTRVWWTPSGRSTSRRTRAPSTRKYTFLKDTFPTFPTFF